MHQHKPVSVVGDLLLFLKVRTAHG